METTQNTQLHCPILESNYDALIGIRQNPTPAGLQAATIIRRNLAADTLAPDWLRTYAAETIEQART
jgi:hypothetical protein